MTKEDGESKQTQKFGLTIYRIAKHIGQVLFLLFFVASLLFAFFRVACHKEAEPPPPMHVPPPDGMTELIAERVTGKIGNARFWMTLSSPLRTHDDKKQSYRGVPERIEVIDLGRLSEGKMYFLVPSIPTTLHPERVSIGTLKYWGFSWVYFHIDNATEQTITMHYDYAEDDTYETCTIPPHTMVSGSALFGNHLLRFFDTDGNPLEAAYVWISPVDKRKEKPNYFYNISGKNTYKIPGAYYSKSRR